MSIRMRKRTRFGPFVFNFTQKGFTSWGIKIGPWSWNSKRKTHRVDLPGPFHWEGKRER